MEAPRLEYVGETPIVIDPLGHHYTIGDRVVIPVIHGSSCSLGERRVVSIAPTTRAQRVWDQETEVWQWHELPWPRVGVRKLGKSGGIGYPDPERIVVVYE